MKKFFLLLPLVAMFAIACSNDDDEGTQSVPATGITITPSSTFIGVIDTWADPTPTLSLAVLPEGADQSVVWSSNKPDVLSVDKNGKLTLLKKESSEVKITAKSAKGVEGNVTLNVVKYGIIDTKTELGFVILDRNLGAIDQYVKGTENAKAYGNYYQWGKNTPVANGADAAVNANYDKEWKGTGANFKDWSVAANTPCPTGWTIPTKAQLGTIGDKAWADWSDILGGQGMDSKTDAENEAAAALFNKIRIAITGFWSIKGDTEADRKEATPVKEKINSYGYFWGCAINKASARGFDMAFGISTDKAGDFITRAGLNAANEVNAAVPIRCIKVN